MNKLALLAVTSSIFVFVGCGGSDQPTTQKQPIISGPVSADSGEEPCEDPVEEEDPEGPQCVPIGGACYLGKTPCCPGSTCVVEPTTTSGTSTDSLIVTAKCLELN